MNLDISQLNNLQKFTRFAFSSVENDPNVDKVKVAQLTGDAVIRNDSDKPGFFGSLFRSRANRQLNNQTRELFKETIAKLFGGEENIPQEVKDAMHFRRFDGKGRPLTAKRINETKSAIINYLSREDVSAGLSPLQMGMVLNTSETVDQYLKSDRNEIDTSVIGSINVDDEEDYEPFKPRNEKLKTLANELNKKVEAFNPQKKTIVNNSNVSGGEDPKTFDDKMKMFQKKNMVFGPAGFVLGKGNPVMEGRRTGTNDIKNDTHATENVDEKYDTVQVVRDKKPRTKKPIFTED